MGRVSITIVEATFSSTHVLNDRPGSVATEILCHQTILASSLLNMRRRVQSRELLWQHLWRLELKAHLMVAHISFTIQISNLII